MLDINLDCLATALSLFQLQISKVEEKSKTVGAGDDPNSPRPHTFAKRVYNDDWTSNYDKKRVICGPKGLSSLLSWGGRAKLSH